LLSGLLRKQPLVFFAFSFLFLHNIKSLRAGRRGTIECILFQKCNKSSIFIRGAASHFSRRAHYHCHTLSCRTAEASLALLKSRDAESAAVMHTYYGPSAPMIYVAGADLFRYKNRVQSPFECAARTKNRCDLHFYAVFGEFPDFWLKTFIT